MRDPDFRQPAADGRDNVPHVVMPWLVRLRWASVAALAAAGWAAVTFWNVQLPVGPLLALLATLAATNAALAFQLRSPVPSRIGIGIALVVDVTILTAILYLAGGPINPFSVIYLVDITVAAVALGPHWALGLALVANAAYGGTFLRNQPLEMSHDASDGMLALHLYGMWVALAAASLLIAYFVGRVSGALEQRERELADARAATARSERLAALLSLGAGAAHELATPLSTIRTAAGELDRTLGTGAADSLPARYVGVIRHEVDRCTSVLDQLSGRASEQSASDLVVALPELLGDVQRRLGPPLAERLDVTLPEAPRSVAAPAEPLRQALVALLRNAFDASGPAQRVGLRVSQDQGFRVEIVDHGRGMDAAESARVGEPFVSTKPPGSGLGLGLFLARSFAAQMGGSLTWSSAPGQGTSVVLDLPSR